MLRVLSPLVVLACAIVLTLIARRAFADANACPTRVVGAKQAQATPVCPDEPCAETGFCEVMQEYETGLTNVKVYVWQDGQWVKVCDNYNGYTRFCGCIAWGGDPPAPYVDGTNICCRAVAVPWGEFSYLGLSGICNGDVCPAGECELEPHSEGGMKGDCVD